MNLDALRMNLERTQDYFLWRLLSWWRWSLGWSENWRWAIACQRLPMLTYLNFRIYRRVKPQDYSRVPAEFLDFFAKTAQVVCVQVFTAWKFLKSGG
jgi:hypothetical protein